MLQRAFDLGWRHRLARSRLIRIPLAEGSSAVRFRCAPSHFVAAAMSSAPMSTRSFNQGQRVTIEGYSKSPGDAIIRKINGDGTLRIRYTDGSTFSSTDPSLATLFFDPDAPAPGAPATFVRFLFISTYKSEQSARNPRAGGRERDGAQLAPGTSRYEEGCNSPPPPPHTHIHARGRGQNKSLTPGASHFTVISNRELLRGAGTLSGR